MSGHVDPASAYDTGERGPFQPQSSENPFGHTSQLGLT